MKRTLSVLLCVCLLAVSLCGCTASDPKPSPSPEPSAPPAQEGSEILNNGGRFVSIGGDVYYRAYTADCVEKTGRMGYFAQVPDTRKSMMVRHPDGQVQAIFTDNGAGAIAFFGDRFYLETKTYSLGEIYTVNKWGGDRRTVMDGCILQTDSERGILICQRGDDLVCYNCGKDEIVPLANDVTFAGYANGVVYYSKQAENYEDALRGVLSLYRVNADATDAKCLVQATPALDWKNDSPGRVVCLQVVGDQIYWNYGGRAGETNEFRGGWLMRCDLDGGDLISIAETGWEPFHVARLPDTDVVTYYPAELSDWKAVQLRLSDRVMHKTSFASAFGEIDISNETGEARAYLDESGEPVTVLPETALPEHTEPYGTGEQLYLVQDVNLVGESVYFSVVRGTHSPQGDVGRQTAYTRTATEVYVYENGASTLLYSY